MAIERALISVTDKSGIIEFAKGIAKFEVEIISTGGTAKVLKEGGVKVIDISDYTGFPEILDGRVKTLHPLVHGGILARRDNKIHMETMKKHGIKRIDLVVVNLYAFEKTIAKNGVTLDEAIENIDIGGPTLLRSSAKNFMDVTVVVDPLDYGFVLKDMEENNGNTTLKTRLYLARKVFAITSSYDHAIMDYLSQVQIQ